MLSVGDPASYFTECLFTRRVPLAASLFIKAMHPKTQINPDPSSVQKILAMGWLGQRKVHGHRAQIHIPASTKEAILVYNRQGKRHVKALTPAMIKELRRLFAPEKDWNVIDAEWIKSQEKIFVFDYLKKDGEVLRRRTFPERWAMLPRNFISPHLCVLPLLKDLPSCLKELARVHEDTEGLVFKSATSIGFSDTSIVRCRRR